MDNNILRSQNGRRPSRKTIHFTLWIKPIVKEYLQRLADREGISLSQAGGALLEKAMQTRIDMQYGAMLEPIIERSITKYLRQRDTRIISLLVRIAAKAEASLPTFSGSSRISHQSC